MKRKRQFHCNTCGSGLEIYKKGKRHRALICPKCGLLATNPLPLLPLLAAAAPSIIGAVSDKISGKSGSKAKETASDRIVTDSLDKPNKGERYVSLALKG